jgi:hypothetical protein
MDLNNFPDPNQIRQNPLINVAREQEQMSSRYLDRLKVVAL